jgi:LysM repeat protein
MFADNYLMSNNCIISDVCVGEEKPIDECSLYIYVVKPNDTLWDIAKEMNVSEDLIVEQNPDILLPLLPGSKLVIYNPKVMTL